MQLLFPGRYATRTDVRHFRALMYVNRILKVRGNKGNAENVLKNLGIKNTFPYLFRNPLFPSHTIISKTDALHQRERGFTERLLNYACTIVFANPDSLLDVLDSYLMVLKRHGFPGLITSNKLFSSSNLSGKDRRILSEALIYACYILEDDPVAMALCDITVLHIRLAEKQDAASHTLASLERLSALEIDFMYAARAFVDTLSNEGKKIFANLQYPKHPHTLEYSKEFRLVRF